MIFSGEVEYANLALSLFCLSRLASGTIIAVRPMPNDTDPMTIRMRPHVGSEDVWFGISVVNVVVVVVVVF